MINSMVSVNRKHATKIPKFLIGSLLSGLILLLESGVCFAQEPPYAENLKAFFKFDGDLNSTYPEIIGSGSATLTTDRFGNPNSALEFDGIDDTFNFSIDEVLWNNFTISVWAKPTKTTTVVSESTSGMSMYDVTPQSPLLYAAHGGSNRTYGFNIGTNGLNVTHYADSLVISSLEYTTDLSEWKHYTFISDSDKAKLYINGSFIKDGLQMNDLRCGSSFTFGKSAPLSTTQYFKGLIDDLYIYDRLLLSSEVPTLYNSAPYAENLKAFFKFDGDLNSTYPEIIGSGSATLTTDRFGNPNSALEFDGIDDTFNFSIDEVLWNNFTISVWAKPTKTTTVVSESTSGMSMYDVTPQSPLLYAAHGGSNRTYGFNIGTNGLNVTHYADSLVISSLEYTTDLSEWKHYTFISDSDKAKLYINGSFIKDGLQMNDLRCGSSFTFGKSAPFNDAILQRTNR